MGKNDAPEWFQIFVIAMIVFALFPTVFVAIFNTVLTAVIVGIVMAIVIVGIWWYLENRDNISI